MPNHMYSAAMRLALLLAVAVALYSHPVSSQTTPDDIIKMSFGTGGRPVAKAIEELVSRYGYAISYEDPRLTYEGDWRDVTMQVRKDLDRYPPGAAPKVIVPQGGALNLTLPASHSISAATMVSLLNQVVQEQANTQQGGHFRVERDGEIFHVDPSEARDQNGNWSAQTPLLDVPISLPTKDRDRMDTLHAIATALEAAAGVTVDIPLRGGGGIGDPQHPRLYRLGADKERARNVLMRALALIWSPPTKVTWRMFCDQRMCAINLRSVPILADSSAPTPVKSMPVVSPANGGAKGPMNLPHSPL
jgi:hypothetical protein